MGASGTRVASSHNEKELSQATVASLGVSRLK